MPVLDPQGRLVCREGERDLYVVVRRLCGAEGLKQRRHDEVFSGGKPKGGSGRLTLATNQPAADALRASGDAWDTDRQYRRTYGYRPVRPRLPDSHWNIEKDTGPTPRGTSQFSIPRLVCMGERSNVF